MVFFPKEIVELIIVWVNEFVLIDKKIQFEHSMKMLPILYNIYSLPIELECKNKECNKLSKNRFICNCFNYKCEYCGICCISCEVNGCYNCIDFVDEQKCEQCI